MRGHGFTESVVEEAAPVWLAGLGWAVAHGPEIAAGSIAGAQARVIDFERPFTNDWLAVNQFTIVEGQRARRPDVVLFVNGLPLAVIELIARELVATVRANVTIDWTLGENVLAQLRVLVKRILRKHGYPPDKQEKATRTVLEQAEVLSEGWAAA